jgi:maltose alpha-D-glucosyltransferase/alpha-amylase
VTATGQQSSAAIFVPEGQATEPGGRLEAPEGGTERWYKDAVIYEVHVRAFHDSDGDGIGDFRGLIQKLDYIQELGVTALWLLPFYPSPLRDDGYDISDYRRVHPSYGTLRDFRAFLRAAHKRGLKVITELVLNHTSDEHPWFQRARRARPGSVQRDFYVWSDTPDRFKQARIIFKDFETSNWTYDPVAGAYFWHRFYSHQPNLNYDNPAVVEAIFEVVDFWLGMGVDGLRLDAIPYLYAREGTSCENLPEVFAFLRRLRAHIDERFDDRMLLAEANQWPEDAVAYMGNGDACQMAFHFPLMPRMFMAARQEDRFPVVDILTETPDPPPDGQWALFLRNHDELTLEMVTDEERDYMYRVYAQDPQARINMGIRRRLAPLLANDRTMIEMMNGLLFSLPGTPIVYYGDEIGMGDNIYLGDRNAVRTPMQWDSDRNAGFSRANPQRLFLPVVIDPVYHFQAVNVEAQEENPSSLLWWMRRLIGLRKRYRAFGRGSLQLLRPDNRKVLAFLRHYEDELILVVVNLSRVTQCVELDLSAHRGATPVELFGNTPFPVVGDLPYFITLGGHGFYWFSLESEHHEQAPRPSLRVSGSWESVLSEPAVTRLEEALPRYIAERRWFASKARTITSVTVVDFLAVPEPGTPRGSPLTEVVLVRVDLDYGSPEQYLLPLAFASGARAEELARWKPEAIVADLRAGREDGVLFDAVYQPAFATAVLDLIARRRSLPGRQGRLLGVPTPNLRRIHQHVDPEQPPVPVSAEQSNSSVVFGDAAIVKFIRRVEEGINPGVEIGRFLGEQARFPYAPLTGGMLQYQPQAPGHEQSTVASLEQYVANEGDGWSYVVDALGHGLEEALAHTGAEELRMEAPPRLLDVASSGQKAAGHLLLGPHLEWASLLGRRTGELHLALTSERRDTAFSPEPLTPIERQSLYHGARSLAKRVLRQAAAAPQVSACVAQVLEREAEVGERLRVMSLRQIDAVRIRCHGDYHLGQVLWTGKDFVIIDFEGEPRRSIGQRRLKRPAVYDLAGMIRSFHYASRAAALRLTRDLDSSLDPVALESWLTLWYRWVSGTFLGCYLEVTRNAGFLPPDDDQLSHLLDFFLLEKALSELGYEINSRPDWVDIPAQGILDILGTAP